MKLHEVSIAQSLLELVQRHASEAKMERVSEIHIRIGSLSCVNSESLRTAYSILAMDTPLESSALRIEETQAKGRCLNCERDYDFPDDFSCFCPFCFGTNTEILEGREMVLDRIEGETVHAY